MVFEKSAVRNLLQESGNLANALKRFEAFYWFKKSFSSLENAIFSKDLSSIKKNAESLLAVLGKSAQVFEFKNPVNLKWFKDEFSEDLEKENLEVFEQKLSGSDKKTMNDCLLVWNTVKKRYADQLEQVYEIINKIKKAELDGVLSLNVQLNNLVYQFVETARFEKENVLLPLNSIVHSDYAVGVKAAIDKLEQLDIIGKNDIARGLRHLTTESEIREYSAAIQKRSLWSKIPKEKKHFFKRVFSYISEIAHHKKLKEKDVEYQQTIADLKQETLFDPLTGCYTKIRILELLKEQILLSNRTGQNFCLLMVDADNFKKINDAAGHVAGDKYLSELGKLLITSVREIDYVGRYGGEELLIVLPGKTVKDGTIVAERLLKNIKTVINNNNLNISVLSINDCVGTLSIGIFSWTPDRIPGDVMDKIKSLPARNSKNYFDSLELALESIIVPVDKLTYAAKRNGRNRYEPQ